MRDRLALGAATLVLFAAGCVDAAPPPFTLAPSIATGSSANPARGTCVVAMIELVDARSDPDTLGVYVGKAIKAPTDRQAWLRSMVLDLTQRGVRPLMGEAANSARGVPRLRFVLEKAWVSNVHDDIGAGVLLRIDDLGQGPAAAIARFRGTKQKMTYFSASEGKLQASLNDAVAQALDALAIHLQTRCAASG